MGNSNSQELSQKVERHETAINTTQAQGITMSVKLKDNIDKIQEQLNMLEARFDTYLTHHTGEHSELTETLQLLQEEIRLLQDKMNRPQPPSAPPSIPETRAPPSRQLEKERTQRSTSNPRQSGRSDNGRRNKPSSRQETRPPVETPVVEPPPGFYRDAPGFYREDNGNPALDMDTKSRMQSIQAKAGTLMLHLLAHEALDIKTDKSFPGYQQKYKSMKSSYHVDTSPLYEFNL